MDKRAQSDNRWTFDEPRGTTYQLENRIHYFYGVTMVTPKGEGPVTGIIEVASLNASNPPRDLSITLIPKGISLNWHEPLPSYGPPVLEYEVHKRQGDGEWSVIGTVPWDQLSFEDKELDVEVNNIYMVRAVNVNGTSLPSEQVKVISHPALPGNERADDDRVGFSTLELFAYIFVIIASVAAMISIFLAVNARRSSKD